MKDEKYFIEEDKRRKKQLRRRIEEGKCEETQKEEKNTKR